MRDRKTTSRAPWRRILLTPLAVVTACCVVAGCSDIAATPTTSATPSSVAANTGGTPQETCAELSEVYQDLEDLRENLLSGEIDQSTFAASAADATARFGAIEADDQSTLAAPLADFQAYLAATEPTADGYPFDRSSDEYRNVALPLMDACDAAGSEIGVTGPGG